MLPLTENKLNNSNDWHKLKMLLVVAKLCDFQKAQQEYSKLPEHLKDNFIGKEVKAFLESRDETILDKAAIQLTQRKLKDAWLTLERL